MVGGTGSQTGTLTRWGDYSSMTVDPADDCTFWYTQEYIKTNGTFNWSTRIANFKFPTCGSSGGSVTLSPNSLNFGSVTVGQHSSPQARHPYQQPVRQPHHHQHHHQRRLFADQQLRILAEAQTEAARLMSCSHQR